MRANVSPGRKTILNQTRNSSSRNSRQRRRRRCQMSSIYNNDDDLQQRRQNLFSFVDILEDLPPQSSDNPKIHEFFNGISF